MKRLFKILCLIMALTFSIANVKYVYADGMSTRTILRYEASGYSDSNRIKVYATLVVQDSCDQIINYSITEVAGVYGVTNTNVLRSEITGNGTKVFVAVEYYYLGSYQCEGVYIDM